MSNFAAELDEGFVRPEGPRKVYFKATFILTNRRLWGQQVFWNGSGTGKCFDFRAILLPAAVVPEGAFSYSIQFGGSGVPVTATAGRPRANAFPAARPAPSPAK